MALCSLIGEREHTSVALSRSEQGGDIPAVVGGFISHAVGGFISHAGSGPRLSPRAAMAAGLGSR